MDNCIKECISNANDFYEVACMIDNKRNEFQYKYMSAFATNLSFSCELYLKAIYMTEQNEKISGHRLKRIFNQLTKETRKLLEIEFNNNKIMNSLEKTLENCDHVFEDFRYLYENKMNYKLYSTDLSILVNSIRKVCKTEFSFEI